MSSSKSLFSARELRVLLHDAEAFIDDQHTADPSDMDCPACNLVERLRAASERIARHHRLHPFDGVEINDGLEV